ncbi:MAG: hypothetical protein KDA93_21590 [Planctomycetaceae bacterium]|nr:hypothetical protein [Planctomycetaceae bacterium]
MFDISWTEAATEELSRIWINAHPEDRELITQTVNDIEVALTKAADTVGESRFDNDRILIVSHIAIQYRVWADQREAVVTNIWRTTGPANP